MQEMQVRSLGQEDSLEKEMEARWQVDSLPLSHQGSPKWRTVAFILLHWAPRAGKTGSAAWFQPTGQSQFEVIYFV